MVMLSSKGMEYADSAYSLSDGYSLESGAESNYETSAYEPVSYSTEYTSDDQADGTVYEADSRSSDTSYESYGAEPAYVYEESEAEAPTTQAPTTRGSITHIGILDTRAVTPRPSYREVTRPGTQNGHSSLSGYKPGRFHLVDGLPHRKNYRTDYDYHRAASTSIRSTTVAKPEEVIPVRNRLDTSSSDSIVRKADGSCLCSCACPTTTTTPRPCIAVHENKNVLIRHAVGFDPDSGDTVNVKERCY
jgi:hypothetical protein